MQDAVKNGRENDAEKGDQHDSTKEGVGGGEDLGRYGRQALAIDRALSSHQHGGFNEGILPSQSTQNVVTDNADAQREADQSNGHEKVKQNSSNKDVVGGQGLTVMLERHPWFVALLAGEAKKQEGGMPKISEKVDENSGHRLQTAGCR